jgi:hypothetical protein
MATAKKPTAKKKVVKGPAAKRKAAEKTVAKKAVAKEPAAQKKAVKRPAPKKTAVEITVAKSAIAEKPPAKKNIVKKKVDYTKLLKLIESGKHQAEIMKVFALKTAAQLKSHYLSALMEAGKVPEIKTNRGSAKASASKEVVVRKTGSVVIDKALVDEMGFVEGDNFSVRKTKSGISLKKIE